MASTLHNAIINNVCTDNPFVESINSVETFSSGFIIIYIFKKKFLELT